MESTEELVREIHKTKAFHLKIIEIGAGCPVASALLSEEGASNTVFESVCPYSKKVQERYISGNHRAVSYGSVEEIINSQYEYETNGTFVSSFQVGQDIISHGWIGYKYKDITKYYHITFPNDYSRQRCINTLEKIGINIIASKNIKSIDYSFDIILDVDGNYLLEEMLYNQADLLCFDETGCVRKEKFLRDKTILNIYKGSFNPLHEGHLNIASQIENTIFAISTETYQKENITPKQLQKRIYSIVELGFEVILFKDQLFSDNKKTIHKFYKNININFLIGMDTFNRIIKTVSTEDFKAFKNGNMIFSVFERPGTERIHYLDELINLDIVELIDYKPIDVSSTQVREILANHQISTKNINKEIMRQLNKELDKILVTYNVDNNSTDYIKLEQTQKIIQIIKKVQDGF